MGLNTSRRRAWNRVIRSVVALGCAVLLVPGGGLVLAQETSAAGTADPADATLPPDQLDALVAPIALYPDPLLAQTLVAATYPLEIIQLQQWMAKNPDLKDKELADAVAKQPWDPAIQSMAAVPEVVNRLADDLQWTTDLGNAFLAQQNDVMDSVQRMRLKAKDKGALESNTQQTVETKVIEQKTVIIVQQTNPEVIYVPSYSPVVVYGPPIYPYPPIYYPPYPPGAAFVSFSIGVAIGASIWGGSCCGCSWGHSNNININVNNNFNRNANINTGNRGGGNNNWQHNAQHRGAAPYSSQATANKYGGSARGQLPSTRQASAKQQPAGGNRSGGASAKPQPSGGGNRGASPRTSNRAAGPATANRGGSGGGDRIGNQNIPKSSPSKAGGFGGGSSGFSGSRAKASRSRGASSMGSRGGGGRRR